MPDLRRILHHLPAQAALSAPAAGHPRPPVRVVLCDDAMTFPLLARHWIEADGDLAVVATTATGQALREWLAGDDADVVLLDLVLPDVEDPADLVGAVRDARPGAAIVLCSSLATDRLAATAARLGADGWVHKANDPEAFRTAVRAAARD